MSIISHELMATSAAWSKVALVSASVDLPVGMGRSCDDVVFARSRARAFVVCDMEDQHM
jgi:hypothetical protein